MRTTLSLDEDVLIVARSIADRERKTLGQVISALARKALQRPPAESTRNGIPLLAPGKTGEPVTLELVNALRDDF